MTTYVLVHGAASGAWVWHRVMPHLKQQGHRVIAPDLPGHGLNPRPMAEITLAAYVDCVGEILAAQTEPVILVGHSLGGAVITQAAEQYPDRIHTLVYLAGYLLRSGETMLEITQADDESLLLANAVFSEDQLSTTFRSEALQAVGYADCDAASMELVRSLLCPQAVAPLATPITTTAERFGQLPRLYITCLQDRVIGPAAQQRMYTALPCDRVIAMNTSHNPYLSAPDELANHLLAIAPEGSSWGGGVNGSQGCEGQPLGVG